MTSYSLKERFTNLIEERARKKVISFECAEGRVKSGNFGHQVNSDTRLQTVEIQVTPLVRIFTVCLVSLFFIPIIEL